MLGRPYEIRATVATGDRRGRTIGFPTANLPSADAVQVPADGVYAGWYIRPNGDRAMSAINIGKRPTFKETGEPSLVEAHLLDFSGDLYGEPARLQFVERLRAERAFDGIDALREQLSSDIDEARRLLTTS
jgi:riboflavin kinase/FMN adenylyltransferase